MMGLMVLHCRTLESFRGGGCMIAGCADYSAYAGHMVASMLKRA
jgi:hypothetical protein